MNFNNNDLFNNKNSENISENFSNIAYYPETSTTAEQKNTNKQFDIKNLGSLMQMLNLFSGKQKLDFTTLLASPLGKSLGIDENASALINMLSANMKKNTVKTQEISTTLPSIDSLERINYD